MEPIEKSTTASLVSEKIVQLIAENYTPGDRLPTETELAEVLKVGRTSVREGLKKLEAVGLVEIRHGKGTYVRRPRVASVLGLLLAGNMLPHKKELGDLFAVRKLIELESARLAAIHAKSNDLNKLKRLLSSMKTMLDDAPEFIKTDLQFHLAIAEASDNSVLPIILDVIRNLFMRQSEVIARIPNITTDSLAFHEQILEAIVEHDAERAKAAMKNHLDHSEEGWIALPDPEISAM